MVFLPTSGQGWYGLILVSDSVLQMLIKHRSSGFVPDDVSERPGVENGGRDQMRDLPGHTVFTVCGSQAIKVRSKFRATSSQNETFRQVYAHHVSSTIHIRSPVLRFPCLWTVDRPRSTVLPAHEVP